MFRLTLLFLFISTSGAAQIYFPPIGPGEWEIMQPAELGYCPDRIDSLYALLEEADSKSFILLKDGRIVLEQYFGTYTQDSTWYWASAAKSLTAFLVGCAQEDGYLDIDDPTSDYLGEGWTVAPPEKEALISIRNQISMTTGLETNVFFPDCLDPECMEYDVDAGDKWFYYNAPYRLTLDVLEEASGAGINLFTWNRLGSRIGMGGIWFDYVRYGKARDMARFGLLALNEGVWATDTVLADTQYFDDMTMQSQLFNEAYGYLWWLNGSNTFMAPGTSIVWPGELTPSAPDDMYAALGKNDQKIYVVPSEGLVVVRQGENAGQVLAGPSSFDESLWEKISELVCNPNGLDEFQNDSIAMYPNPANDWLYIDEIPIAASWSIMDMFGRTIITGNTEDQSARIDVSNLPPAQYMLRIEGIDILRTGLFLKQ
jgi:CubicO group peptidase (beta-lactamase class C family)